jgi:hypothetical protein
MTRTACRDDPRHLAAHVRRLHARAELREDRLGIGCATRLERLLVPADQREEVGVDLAAGDLGEDGDGVLTRALHLALGVLARRLHLAQAVLHRERRAALGGAHIGEFDAHLEAVERVLRLRNRRARLGRELGDGVAPLRSTENLPALHRADIPKHIHKAWR